MIIDFPGRDEARNWYLIDDYYANADRNVGYENYFHQKSGLLKTYRRRNRLVGKSILFGKKKILEIGCGPGFYPETLDPRLASGYTGLDINCGAIDVLRKKGFTGIAGEIDDLPENRRFDIVVMFDVLEHILEPNAFLSSLKKRMKPGGKVILSTPSTTSLLSRISGRKWVSYVIPQHVILYNPKSLKHLFGQNGFHAEIIKTDVQWADMAFIAKRIEQTLPYGKAAAFLLKKFSRIINVKLPVINGNMFCMFGLSDEG